MAIERTYYCDAPDCEHHGASATPPPYVPWGFLEVRQTLPGGEETWHACSWDCLMKLGASFPPPERIEMTDG
jgi:hypothetical protein